MRKPVNACANNKFAQSDQRLCFRCLDSVIPLFAVDEI